MRNGVTLPHRPLTTRSPQWNKKFVGGIQEITRFRCTNFHCIISHQVISNILHCLPLPFSSFKSLSQSVTYFSVVAASYFLLQVRDRVSTNSCANFRTLIRRQPFDFFPLMLIQLIPVRDDDFEKRDHTKRCLRAIFRLFTRSGDLSKSTIFFWIKQYIRAV